MLRVNDSKNRPFAEEGESSPVEVLRSLSGMFMGKGDELYILYRVAHRSVLTDLGNG